jgi:hypothetical protein
VDFNVTSFRNEAGGGREGESTGQCHFGGGGEAAWTDRLLTALEVGSVHDATAVVAGIDVAAVALGWLDEGDARTSGPS